MNESCFYEQIKQCLIEADVEQTLIKSEKLCARFVNDENQLAGLADEQEDLVPVFPDKPRLVSPASLPKRGFASEQGRAALIHAIAHIEYNAIHLAWDAVYRFRDLPDQFRQDWVRVAREETRHFRLLQERLQDLSCEYGDFDAHDGLWRVASNTRHDPLVRMALVPRVLEARGLDVTPGMMKKFRAAGDDKTADILSVIYEDEIGHVEIGSYWFHYLCKQQELEPESTFRKLIDSYYDDGLRGPYNIDARKQAGFSENEITWLQSETIH